MDILGFLHGLHAVAWPGSLQKRVDLLAILLEPPSPCLTCVYHGMAAQANLRWRSHSSRQPNHCILARPLVFEILTKVCMSLHVFPLRLSSLVDQSKVRIQAGCPTQLKLQPLRLPLSTICIWLDLMADPCHEILLIHAPIWHAHLMNTLLKLPPLLLYLKDKRRFRREFTPKPWCRRVRSLGVGYSNAYYFSFLACVLLHTKATICGSFLPLPFRELFSLIIEKDKGPKPNNLWLHSYFGSWFVPNIRGFMMLGKPTRLSSIRQSRKLTLPFALLLRKDPSPLLNSSGFFSLISTSSE
ncbi:hypothetical protein VNO77_19341 [Canavalia gladiata]|uniref:Uncharacterized protein n=1 Tax=Canavalia gladiata TaxID=3824 RepID=A0AAN9LR59_CANGL